MIILDLLLHGVEGFAVCSSCFCQIGDCKSNAFESGRRRCGHAPDQCFGFAVDGISAESERDGAAGIVAAIRFVEVNDNFLKGLAELQFEDHEVFPLIVKNDLFDEDGKIFRVLVEGKNKSVGSRTHVFDFFFFF